MDNSMMQINAQQNSMADVITFAQQTNNSIALLASNAAAMQNQLSNISMTLETITNHLYIEGAERGQIKKAMYARISEFCKEKGIKNFGSAQGKLRQRFWIAFNSHYTIASYSELPSKFFHDALKYIPTIEVPIDGIDIA